MFTKRNVCDTGPSASSIVPKSHSYVSKTIADVGWSCAQTYPQANNADKVSIALVFMSVICFFLFYDCGRSVAGIENSIIGHSEQFCADSCHECLMVAVGKIGAAVAALEYHVAGKDTLLLPVPEYHAAG